MAAFWASILVEVTPEAGVVNDAPIITATLLMAVIAYLLIKMTAENRIGGLIMAQSFFG